MKLLNNIGPVSYAKPRRDPDARRESLIRHGVSRLVGCDIRSTAQ